MATSTRLNEGKEGRDAIKYRKGMDSINFKDKGEYDPKLKEEVAKSDLPPGFRSRTIYKSAS